MLVGRFMLMIPVLAIAGSLGRKQADAAVGRHVPDEHAAVRRAAHRRRRDRRRPHVLPRHRARPRSSSISSESSEERTVTVTTDARRSRRSCRARPPKVRTRAATSMFDPAIMRRAVGDSFVKLDPRQMARNPVMFVVEIGSVLTTILFFQKLPLGDGVRQRVRRARVGVAVVHGAVRQLRRSRRRRARQGAGRHAAQDARRHRRPGSPAPTARRQRRRRASSPSATSASCPPAS